MSIEKTLKERGKTHGDFSDNARIAQNLKRAIADSPNWHQLSNVQKEALHMILHKVARICSGNPDEKDHWKDISGYATLVEERI